jgi:hypothetical protein
MQAQDLKELLQTKKGQAKFVDSVIPDYKLLVEA